MSKEKLNKELLKKIIKFSYKEFKRKEREGKRKDLIVTDIAKFIKMEVEKDVD